MGFGKELICHLDSYGAHMDEITTGKFKERESAARVRECTHGKEEERRVRHRRRGDATGRRLR